ncbi:MAG: hypothetical protein U0163_04440 [Gemmatimonadaceae bacterium]
MRTVTAPTVRAGRVLIALAIAAVVSCERGGDASTLAGDWDWYQMLGATPTGGFEARRRVGFVHLDRDVTASWIRRRSGAPLATIGASRRSGDSVELQLKGMRGADVFRGAIHGDTVAGVLFAGQSLPRAQLWFGGHRPWLRTSFSPWTRRCRSPRSP